jgi:copper chaperone CopZ
MKLELAIDGMHCDGCVRRVKNLLGKVAGVASADVSLGKATLELTDAKVEASVRATLEKAGYGVGAGASA